MEALDDVRDDGGEPLLLRFGTYGYWQHRDLLYRFLFFERLDFRFLILSVGNCSDLDNFHVYTFVLDYNTQYVFGIK